MKRGIGRNTPSGFTLVEMIVAMAIGSIVLVAALSGVISLQKSYAASEQYAANLADQMRLSDYLALDLRRSSNVAFDADMNGMTLTLPDYYYFSPTDPQHAQPLPNVPVVASDHSQAIYGNPAQPPTIYYHFDTSSTNVTREEVPGGQAPTNAAPAQQIIASGMAAFPTILLDNPQSPLTARVTVTFHPMFQTPSTPDSNSITLHGLTFLRNNQVHAE